ncbi:MAG: hypothetical protein VKO44_07140 [Cyanobacteriota bacterium]|nr:hypothetical protein [Cyanobacteriota bacterium]
MAQQQSTIHAWLAMHQAPQPPDRLDQPSPEQLGAYLEGVEARLQRLALVLAAMRETLEAAGLFNEAQLLAKVQEIDLRDGSADGREGQPGGQRCGACGRISAGFRRRCLYCGSEQLLPLQPHS